MASDAFARKVSLLSVLALLMAAAFGYGYCVGAYELWPYSTMNDMRRGGRQLVKYGRFVPNNLVVDAPADAPRQRFTMHRQDDAISGQYVVVGWTDEHETYAGWLYDAAGTLKHTWVIDYGTLDPDGPRNGGDMPHAAAVLEDGSMLVSFDKGDVMARIDACGQPLWTKTGVYHHSLDRAEDGSFWTWRGPGTAYGHHNYLENFDPETGETLRELELVEDIIKRSGHFSAAFGVRPDHPFEQHDIDPPNEVAVDIFHPNDIGVLHSSMADAFPQFEAGDLVISLRTISLVAVVDGDDGTTKWSSNGPWRYQHDPDFLPDGTISVFNNNSHRPLSEIIVIDPVSGVYTNPLIDGDFRFYTEAMGKHQYLPNGNILIVVPGEGRVVEVTSRGDKVLEFNNVSQISDEFNMHIENAMWLPEEYFDSSPTCS